MGYDEGDDISSPELAAAISAGWWLTRAWMMRGGEVLLTMELRRAAGATDGSTNPAWITYQRSYISGELDMLTQEIARGHAIALALRAMQEHPPEGE